MIIIIINIIMININILTEGGSQGGSTSLSTSLSNIIIKYLYQISLSNILIIINIRHLRHHHYQLVAEKVAGRSPSQQKSLHPLHYQDHHHHHHHDPYHHHHYHYHTQVKPEDVPLNLRGEGVTTHTMRLTWDQPIRSIIF